MNTFRVRKGVGILSNTVAKKLVKLRGDRSRGEIASGLGISVSAVQMYENGKRVPKDSIKVRIARYYGVSVESIFFASESHKMCPAHQTA